MEDVQKLTAPAKEQSRAIDMDKIEALRKYMLLTIDSLVKLYGVSRVSYYNWLRGKTIRAATASRVRRVTRHLATCVAQHGWPNEMAFVASQSERLKMLEDLIATLDNSTE